MKEKLLALWLKVQENKDVVIKVSAVLVGAAVGALAATIISNAQKQYDEYDESELLGLDSEDDETEDGGEEEEE